MQLIGVCCADDLADNIVALGEECDPVVQDALLLIVEVLPLGLHILWVCGGESKGTRRILASEHFF